MGIRRLFRRESESFPVEKITAARAVYVDSDTQRIDLTLEVDGERMTLELTPRQAASLVGQLTVAYEAINLPLRGGGAARFLGMT